MNNVISVIERSLTQVSNVLFHVDYTRDDPYVFFHDLPLSPEQLIHVVQNVSRYFDDRTLLLDNLYRRMIRVLKKDARRGWDQACVVLGQQVEKIEKIEKCCWYYYRNRSLWRDLQAQFPSVAQRALYQLLKGRKSYSWKFQDSLKQITSSLIQERKFYSELINDLIYHLDEDEKLEYYPEKIRLLLDQACRSKTSENSKERENFLHLAAMIGDEEALKDAMAWLDAE